MEKITAKQAREAWETLSEAIQYKQSVLADRPTIDRAFASEDKLGEYLTQQVAIEEADAAAVPLSRR